MKTNRTPLIIVSSLLALMLCQSCHKDLRQRAAEEARQYTEKYCPTPVDNYVRTDSTVFDLQTDEYIYYCTLTGPIDSHEFVDFHRAELVEGLRQAIRQSIPLQRYKQSGFTFRYVCRSEAAPDTILMDERIHQKDYQ